MVKMGEKDNIKKSKSKKSTSKPAKSKKLVCQNVLQIHVISTVFESKDKPTQMTKQSFTIVDFITYRKSIHFELICKDVHN